jgi:hypothetical protein
MTPIPKYKLKIPGKYAWHFPGTQGNYYHKSQRRGCLWREEEAEFRRKEQEILTAGRF